LLIAAPGVGARGTGDVEEGFMGSASWARAPVLSAPVRAIRHGREAARRRSAGGTPDPRPDYIAKVRRRVRPATISNASRRPLEKTSS
jgi:hypothetical protein